MWLRLFWGLNTKCRPRDIIYTTIQAPCQPQCPLLAPNSYCCALECPALWVGAAAIDGGLCRRFDGHGVRIMGMAHNPQIIMSFGGIAAYGHRPCKTGISRYRRIVDTALISFWRRHSSTEP